MKIKTYTENEKLAAKLAGFRTKKPKKPKSKTVRSLESYIVRYNAWVDKLKERAKTGQVKVDAKKKLESLKHQISML